MLKRSSAAMLSCALLLFALLPYHVSAASFKDGQVYIEQSEIAENTLSQEQMDELTKQFYQLITKDDKTVSFNFDDYIYNHQESAVTTKDIVSVQRLYETLVCSDASFSTLNRNFLNYETFDWSFRHIQSFEVFPLISENKKQDAFLIQSKLNDIIAQLPANLSDGEKAQFFHDYIASHCTYDYDSYYDDFTDTSALSHHAYNPVLSETGMCDGLSIMYSYLMNAVGVECYVIDSSSLHHACNLVKINGSWEFVDVTWDLKATHGELLHTHLLNSYKEFCENGHAADDWITCSGWNVTYLVNHVSGDIDGDGILSLSDIIYMQKYLNNSSVEIPEHLYNMDLDNDGQVDIFDLALMKRLFLYGYEIK